MIIGCRRALMLVLLVSFACGCSSVGEPSAPALDVRSFPEMTGQTGSVQSERGAGRYLWGYWLLYFEPDRSDFEIVPIREGDIHWNVLKWLEQGPCTNCLSIKNIHPSGNGTVLVDVEITHPFGNPNLTGFDVRGIAMFSGNHLFPVSGLNAPDKTLGDGELVNADGYTALYNITTEGSGPDGMQGYFKGEWATKTPPDALLNGFKLFISDDPANTRNAFFAGDTVTVTYEIDMPDGAFVMGYAVDASWAPAINKPVEDPMTDFGPEANCPEPWKVQVSGNDLGSAPQVDLTVDVYDWSGKMSHGPPVLECPELFAGTVSAVWTEDGIGYSRYVATVHNELDPGQGKYRCLVSVGDNENDPVNEPWLDLTAYQVHEINADVLVEQLPPVAIASADPLVASPDEPVHFQDDGSYDPDGGSIVKFEWDWDDDGVYDEEGADTFHSWASVGVYQVQFRVTDDEMQTDELDQPIQIQIKGESGWANTELGNLWNNEVISDNNGSVYVAGCSSDFIMTATKVDSQGTIIWTYAFENEMSAADGIDVDESGNVYVTGFFFGDVDFDSGPGEDIHTSIGGSDIFLVKLDNHGNYLWGVGWGGDLSGGSYSFESGHGVAVDDFGGVYCCGDFRGYCDFDPGPGLAERTSNGYPDGAFDAFVSKFDAAGQFQWVQTWGSPDPAEGSMTTFGDRSTGVATDSQGSAYVLGGFCGTVDFDPGTDVDERIATSEYGDVYLLKWSSGGDYQWVRTWSGVGEGYFPGIDQGWGGSTVTVDCMDNILAVSDLDGYVDLDPGPGLVEYTGSGISLSEFDVEGNFKWADIWESSGLIKFIAYGVNTDTQGNIFVAGSHEETVDLDPGTGEDIHENTGYRSSFCVKLDESGNFLWGNSWGPTSTDLACEAWGVDADENGSPYVCGLFEGSVDFDPGPGSDVHSASDWTGYLVKFLPDGTW